jgi:hypothetical protein
VSQLRTEKGEQIAARQNSNGKGKELDASIQGKAAHRDTQGYDAHIVCPLLDFHDSRAIMDGVVDVGALLG